MQLTQWKPQDQIIHQYRDPYRGLINDDRELEIFIPNSAQKDQELYFSLNNKIYYKKHTNDYVNSKLSQKSQYLSSIGYPGDLLFGTDYSFVNNSKNRSYRNSIVYSQYSRPTIIKE